MRGVNLSKAWKQLESTWMQKGIASFAMAMEVMMRMLTWTSSMTIVAGSLLIILLYQVQSLHLIR